MSKNNKNNADRYREAAQNRKARFSYSVEDTIEAGIVLTGTEVKSLRKGHASLQDAFAGDVNGQLMLMNCYIAEYGHAGRHLQHESRRPRLLLVHKRQRDRLLGLVKREGMTIVPLSIYFNARGFAKVNLGLAKGKDKADKRASIKEREWNRNKSRILKNR